MDNLEIVWRALSGPTRREILDLLKPGPLTTGAISNAFPDLSRFAIMQHIELLSKAKLVVHERLGKQRFNYLNAAPLRAIYERWIGDFTSFEARKAHGLKKFVEEKSEMNVSDQKSTKIITELHIKAKPEDVYDAMLNKLDDWWPHRYKPEGKVRCEAKVGGRIYEDWGGEAGALYGVIVWIEPNFKVASSGPSALTQGFNSFSVQTVEADNEGTKYRCSLTIWGDIPEGIEESFSEGSKFIWEQGLKRYLEEDRRYEFNNNKE